MLKKVVLRVTLNTCICYDISRTQLDNLYYIENSVEVILTKLFHKQKEIQITLNMKRSKYWQEKISYCQYQHLKLKKPILSK